MRKLELSGAEFTSLVGEILKQKKAISFQARGNSMFPFIKDGDTVTLESSSKDSLKPGDAAAFLRANGQVVIHRLVRLSEGVHGPVFHLRGDGITDPEEKICFEDLLGKVVQVERNGRTVSARSLFSKVSLRIWHETWPVGPGLTRLIRSFPRAPASFVRKAQSSPIYGVAGKQFIGAQVRYRIAVPQDAPAISHFWIHCGAPRSGNDPETLAGSLQDCEGESKTLLAFYRETLVGTAILSRFPHRPELYPDWWIFNMFVYRWVRRCGIGEGICRLARETVLGQGGKRIYLRVDKSNRAARELYGKMGFSPAELAKTETGPMDREGDDLKRTRLLSAAVESDRVSR